MTLLLVDDDPEIRLLAGVLLRDAGHTVREAADAAEAEMLLATDVDVVLMDVMLGEADGVALARRLLDGRASTPLLVFLTGAVRDDQIRRMRDAGAAGIVHKPFDPTTLVERVQAIVDGAA